MMEARIHLDRPASGITFGGEVDVERPIHLLGLSLDAAAERAAGGHGGALVPTDRWARGDDVVAVYEPQDSRALRATAMWRRLATANAAVTAWELIISCQTSLLESDATVVVRSRVPASGFAVPSSPPDRRWSDASRGDALETLPSEAILARISSGPTVLVAAHRLDARRLTIQSVSARPANGEPAADIEYWLFPSVVEKGVLLRGRVLAAIGPRESDTEWASGLIDAFNASPPPLTA